MLWPHSLAAPSIRRRVVGVGAAGLIMVDNVSTILAMVRGVVPPETDETLCKWCTALIKAYSSLIKSLSSPSAGSRLTSWPSRSRSGPRATSA